MKGFHRVTNREQGRAGTKARAAVSRSDFNRPSDFHLVYFPSLAVSCNLQLSLAVSCNLQLSLAVWGYLIAVSCRLLQTLSIAYRFDLVAKLLGMMQEFVH